VLLEMVSKGPFDPLAVRALRALGRHLPADLNVDEPLVRAS
jgi:hypothetical protein